MEFRCRLGTAGGQVIEGVYVAPSEAHLRRELEDKGLHVLSLAPRGAVSRGCRCGRRTIKRHEFLIFNQELATLLKAGMPLVQSLDILRQRLTNPVFKAVLDDVHEKVRGGTALSDAFGAHADLFSGVYTASLVAGERSGSLDTVLRRFVAYSKVIDTVRRKTISALLYPAILVALAVGLVGDHRRQGGAGVLRLLLELRPGAAAGHPGHRRRLRCRRRTTSGCSLGRRWPPRRRRSRRGCGGRASGPRFDRWLLRLPVLGPIAHKFATSQIARTLAALIGGGIPLVNALDTAATSTEQPLPRRRAAHGGRAGPRGPRLRRDAARAPGGARRRHQDDRSGRVDRRRCSEMLTSLADFYDEDVETEVGRFVTLIEPMLLVFMGVVIAGVVLALYLPLFQLSSVMGR